MRYENVNGRWIRKWSLGKEKTKEFSDEQATSAMQSQDFIHKQT